VRTFYTIIKGGSLRSPLRPPGHAGRAIRSGRSRRTRSGAAETSRPPRAERSFLCAEPLCSPMWVVYALGSAKVNPQ
jgi:hypothetical protein